jgi:formyltetrahydrofolate hydrolase
MLAEIIGAVVGTGANIIQADKAQKDAQRDNFLQNISVVQSDPAKEKAEKARLQLLTDTLAKTQNAAAERKAKTQRIVIISVSAILGVVATIYVIKKIRAKK